MPDDSLKRYLRASIIQAGGPGMMSSIARSRGFPSAQAMEFWLQVAARCHQGGSITRADIDTAAKLYPAVPRQALYGYASRINAAEPGTARRDAVIRESGFGAQLAEAAQEVESYVNADFARGIAAKREERSRGSAPTEADLNHPVRKFNDDARSRREMIERQFPEERDFKPGSDYRSTRRQLADRMDEQAERYDLAEINAHANGKERTRADDIAYAIDRDHTMQQADALLGSEDLIEPLAEAQSGDNPS